MDLYKIIFEHELTINTADTWLQTENSMVGWHSQVDDSVVESDILSNNRLFAFFALFVATSSFRFSLLVKNLTTSILNLEGQVGHRFVDTPDLFYLKLDLLRASIDWWVRYRDLGNNLNDRLFGNLAREGDHALAYRFSNEKDSLNCCIALSSHDEAHLSFGARIVHTASDSHLLVFLWSVQILHLCINFLETDCRVALRSVQGQFTEFVSTGIVRIFLEFILLCFLFLALSETLLLNGLLCTFFLFILCTWLFILLGSGSSCSCSSCILCFLCIFSTSLSL